MTKEEKERLFVNAFIIGSKKERTIDLLSSKKRRSKILSELYHFSYLDPRYVSKVPVQHQNAVDIYNLLKARGAQDVCYIISPYSNLDQQIMKLKSTLELIVGFNPGVLLSCVPGKLGYYEGEDWGVRYILERNLKRNI